MRIAVVQGTVYDVHLTRSLHHAELIRSLPSRGALERSDATLKIRDGGANAMEQDGLAQFVGLHGWRLDGPYIEPPFALAEQLNAKFPAPPGEAFLGRQLRPSRSPIGQRSEGPSRAPASARGASAYEMHLFTPIRSRRLLGPVIAALQQRVALLIFKAPGLAEESVERQV